RCLSRVPTGSRACRFVPSGGDADTAFDRVRDDERFKRVIAERHANAVRERAEVDALRSQKVIPQNLRWR
ncbi:MAG TPA: hypothetical protein VGI23_10685, partial [Steroidobacteraceae bacterium]